MDRPPNVDTLSPELILEIAAYVDRLDLLAFRLASRQVRAAVDNFFLDPFFKERKHLCTTQSLEVLAEIAARPWLARRIEHVYFVVAGPFGHPSHPDLGNERKEREAKYRRRLCDKWREDRTRLWSSDYERGLIVDIFECLSTNLNGAKRLTVTLSNGLGVGEKAYGTAIWKDSLAHSSTEHGRSSTDSARAVSAVVSAMACSNVKVHKLNLCTSIWAPPLAPEAFDTDRDLIHKMRDMSGCLTTLELGLNGAFTRKDGGGQQLFCRSAELCQEPQEPASEPVGKRIP